MSQVVKISDLACFATARDLEAIIPFHLSARLVTSDLVSQSMGTQTERGQTLFLDIRGERGLPLYFTQVMSHTPALQIPGMAQLSLTDLAFWP